MIEVTSTRVPVDVDDKYIVLDTAGSESTWLTKEDLKAMLRRLEKHELSELEIRVELLEEKLEECGIDIEEVLG